MSYCQFYRQEILKKAKERYSKVKAAEYYLQNKEAIKEKSKTRYNNLSEEEKDKIEEYQRKRYQQLIQCKKEALQNKWVLFLFSIGINRVNKKEFHKSKEPIDLDKVNVVQIVLSDKFKPNDDGFKYFIGYKEGEIVQPLCIILPQNEWIHKILWKGWQKHVFHN